MSQVNWTNLVQKTVWSHAAGLAHNKASKKVTKFQDAPQCFFQFLKKNQNCLLLLGSIFFKIEKNENFQKTKHHEVEVANLVALSEQN